MRQVIHKWFWAWEFEKEEQWLNEMSAKGLALVGIGYCRYEFEPCDILKARELVISRKRKYVKAEGEDFNSIVTGIMQPKGDIHLNIGKPLSAEEIEAAAKSALKKLTKTLGAEIRS